MAARVTQIAREILLSPTPDARVTQIAREILLTPTNRKARVTQVVRETIMTTLTSSERCHVAAFID